MSQDQVIHLRLRKDYFEPYLRKKFNAKSNQPIRIDRTNPIGKFIHAHVSQFEFPVRKDNTHTTSIVLSDFRYAYADRRFLGIRRDDMEKINDYIEAQIELEQREMIIVGKELGFDIQFAISVFLEQVLGCEKFEMVKKSDYRLRKKNIELLCSSVQRVGVQKVTK